MVARVHGVVGVALFVHKCMKVADAAAVDAGAATTAAKQQSK
jgi:hypothetical protein